MAVTAASAVIGMPERYNIDLGTASGTGKINVGDWLYYSGNFVLAGSGYTVANKASGAGVALQPNPTYDSFGNIVTATALQYLRQGIIRVSAYTGSWILGTPVWPSATGSGLAAPTGLTGYGAVWAAAVKTGAGSAFATGVGIVVGHGAVSNGSAQIDVLIRPPAPDYY